MWSEACVPLECISSTFLQNASITHWAWAYVFLSTPADISLLFSAKSTLALTSGVTKREVWLLFPIDGIGVCVCVFLPAVGHPWSGSHFSSSEYSSWMFKQTSQPWLFSPFVMLLNSFYSKFQTMTPRCSYIWPYTGLDLTEMGVFINLTWLKGVLSWVSSCGEDWCLPEWHSLCHLVMK